jgi:hypothetical protein
MELPSVVLGYSFGGGGAVMMPFSPEQLHLFEYRFRLITRL